MTQFQTPTKRPPILRVLGWISVSMLLVGWLAGASLWFSLSTCNRVAGLFFWSQLGAFLIGISSLDRLGGIATGLAALTLCASMVWAIGPMSAG